MGVLPCTGLLRKAIQKFSARCSISKLTLVRETCEVSSQPKTEFLRVFPADYSTEIKALRCTGLLRKATLKFAARCSISRLTLMH